jgi:diacylglycerol O-acyltransferase / wax synthase
MVMPGGEVHDAARMTDFEAVMWALERDPQLSSAFANVTIFDRPPEPERFRRRMASACRAVPRLRQRVVPAPARLAPPEWREDPDFDLDHHLRWIDLGGDADERALYDVVAEVSQQPFDRDRPLWEFVVIDGLRHGRAAMVQRLHPAITDGEGGIRISVQFLDLERQPEVEPTLPEPDTIDLPPPADSTAWLPRTAGAIGHVARRSAEQAARAAGSVGSLVLHPDQLPGKGADLVAIARSAVRQLTVDGRRSPLWTERSLDRWFGTTTLYLDDVRTAAHALDGSVNDLFVTGAAAAAARAHERAGLPVEQLRVSIPVSTRHDRKAGGNAFSPSQTLVATGDMSPQERFASVHETLQAVKSERVLGSVEGAAAAVNLLPTSALVRTGQRMAGSVDFVCSNVKAAPFDLFIAGAFMEANYPIGPLAGTAFNLTTMSYRGWLFLGLLVDTAAVRDPDALLADLELSYRELLAAGGVTEPRPFEPGPPS